MSTISSQFHAIGTAVGRDLYVNKDNDDKKLILVTRMGVLVAILLTVFLAYVLPTVWMVLLTGGDVENTSKASIRRL